MVPAHDEESVIGDTLESFRNLVYPGDRFEVHVVADNCTDSTAAIVRTSGWHVHERFAPDAPGKGPALNWLFERIDRTSEFDVAVVVDADTILDPAFLQAMDRAFANGAVAAQGFYSVRDPGSSAAAGVRFAALACRHHLRPLGRCRLGASAGLYGNGMAFQRSLLRDHRWSGHLVEDAEFQMTLLLDAGITVTYVPAARLEAEMPTTLAASESQHARWERGRIDLARRYVPVLARRVSTGPPGSRWVHLDALADHLLPPLSALVALQGAGVVLASAGTALGRRGARRCAPIAAAALVVTGVHVLVALVAVRAPRSVYRSLAQVPKMIVWKLGLWVRMLTPSRDVTWTRTRRNAER